MPPRSEYEGATWVTKVRVCSNSNDTLASAMSRENTSSAMAAALRDDFVATYERELERAVEVAFDVFVAHAAVSCCCGSRRSIGALHPKNPGSAMTE